MSSAQVVPQEPIAPPAAPEVPALPFVDTSKLAGFAPQLITDGAGLTRVRSFLDRAANAVPTAANRIPVIGLDTETNCVNSFFWRRMRTLQVGNTDEQYVIDLLAFADGNTQKLTDAQGYQGRNSSLLDPVKDAVRPALCTNALLKCGVNLGFEYEVLRWNLGMRIWHLFSCDMVERVICAGAHGLKIYSYYAMDAMVRRYFGKDVDKTLQESFNMTDPLSPEQVNYAGLDTYLPLALRQQQLKTIERDRLVATSQIENDAIGPYIDMHINGQRLDRERWMKRIDACLAELVELLQTLDTFFIPVMGHKTFTIEALEEELIPLEATWRDLDLVEPEELAACAAYKKVSVKKEPVLRAQMKEVWAAMERARKLRKAEARAAYSEKSKERTQLRNRVAKCPGNALINYNSGDQLLEAFSQMRGFTTIDATDDDTLLKYNDKPLIKALRRYKKLKKSTGTYGKQWTQTWITKPCKEEGWLHPGDERLHGKYNQLDTETGRSSSSQPNCQNLPKDDDVRACFIADPPDESVRVSVCCDDDVTVPAGQCICVKCNAFCETKAEEQCIVTIDMAGAELRIIAELANASSWINAFTAGWDVHSVGTEILYPDLWPTLTVKSVVKPDGWMLEDSKAEKIPQFNDDGTPLMKNGKHAHVGPCAYFAKAPTGDLARQKCECPGHKKLRDGNKATNFLLAYGGGPNALADEIGVTVDAAKELMRLHESKFPDIWGYLKRSGEQARFNKEARDLYGRRRLFLDPTWDGAREFFIQDHDDRLELSEEEAAENILRFKVRNLRPPTDEEEYPLTHREPSTKEISSSYRGMFGSIERRGKNHCIQGSNASIIKRAMGCGADNNGKAYLWHTLPTFRAKLQSMVHDELVIGCPKRFGQAVAELVADAFLRAAAEVMTKVQMLSDYHISDRWQK